MSTPNLLTEEVNRLKTIMGISEEDYSERCLFYESYSPIDETMKRGIDYNRLTPAEFQKTVAQLKQPANLTDAEIKFMENSLVETIKREVVNRGVRLLTVNADPKTLKSFLAGYGALTGVLYLAPTILASTDKTHMDMCPCASTQCKYACLNTSGKGAMSAIQKARIGRTQYFAADKFKKSNPEFQVTSKAKKSGYEETSIGFLRQLQDEIMILKNLAKEYGLRLHIRLNGTSDVDFYKKLEQFVRANSDVQFYDYTKVEKYIDRTLSQTSPAIDNYHLTYSRSEENDAKAMEYLKRGVNVSIVFDKLPRTMYYKGFQVINGDETDLRALDKIFRHRIGQNKGLIVGLKAKGKAIKMSKIMAQTYEFTRKYGNNYVSSPEFKNKLNDYIANLTTNKNAMSLFLRMTDPKQVENVYAPDKGFVVRTSELEQTHPEYFNPRYKIQ